MIARNPFLFLASSTIFSRSMFAAAAVATRNAVAFIALTRPYDLIGGEGRCRYHSGRRCTANENTMNNIQDSHSNWSYNERVEAKESVTGVIYSDDSDSNDNSLTVTLFTKKGCTLCDKVVEVLQSVRGQQPHCLMAVDITDPDKSYWYQKYKYDIPILHINGRYWAKHRLTKDQALSDLEAARIGSFVEKMEDEPDAGAMEQRQAERMSQRKHRNDE
jgi:hypothetical protein